MHTQHKLSLAILLALVAGSASADFTSSAQTSSGAAQASSIIFSAIDSNSSSANYGATFVFDLAIGDAGLNYESFVNGTQGTKGTLSWDLSQNAAFSAFAADNTQLQWTVLGGEALTSSKSNLTTWGVLTTETGTAASFSTLETALAPEVSSGNLENYFGNVNTVLDANGTAPSNVGTFASGSLSNITDLGSTLQLNGSIYANLGGAGNTIPLWLLQNSNTSSRNPTPNVITDLGSFSLSGNTLSYTSASASAVPLPATVWVFLSGLLGVMGLKRRAKQA